MYKKSGLFKVVAILLVVILMGTACGAPAAQQSAPPDVKPQDNSAPPVQTDNTGSEAVDEIIIGALYPLTGPQAPMGTEVKNGVEFGVEIVNNAYPGINLPLAAEEGIPSLGGAKIKIVYGDTQSVPEKGMSLAEQILTSDNAVAIIGAFNSSVAATIAQVTERMEKVFLVPDCTSPSLTQNNFKWFFRLTPDDVMFIGNMVGFLNDMNAEKNAGLKTVAIVNENSLFGQDFEKVARQLLSENGYEVVEQITYAANTVEVNSEVQKIKKANPDVVLHATYVSDAILYMKTYKEQNFLPKVLLTNAGGFIDSSYFEVVGADGDYVVTRSVFSQDIGENKPIIKEVNELYKQKYGHDMNEYSARSFMGVIVMADALNRAGTTESHALREAMLATDIPAEQIIMAWDGIKFDPENGQNVLGKGLVGQIFDREIRTVWPFDLATVDVVYPMPGWGER